VKCFTEASYSCFKPFCHPTDIKCISELYFTNEGLHFVPIEFDSLLQTHMIELKSYLYLIFYIFLLKVFQRRQLEDRCRFSLGLFEQFTLEFILISLI